MPDWLLAHHPGRAEPAHRPPAAQPPRALQRHQRRHAARDRAAVEWANAEDTVRDRRRRRRQGFCGGYDLAASAEGQIEHPCQQESAVGPDGRLRVKRNTDDFMSLWRSPKPTIAKVHGAAVAGGSDIALSCDLLVMAEDARIGYMPTRVWGCPTTAMWTYRLGPARQTADVHRRHDRRAHRSRLGAGQRSGARGQLDAAARRSWPSASPACPRRRLAMHKMVVNQVMLTMGLEQNADDGHRVRRHHPPQPEGLWFRRYAQEHGFKTRGAVARQQPAHPRRRRGARWCARWTNRRPTG